ncbi:hypothetical protein KIH74_01825 [Kineosporia sp. J2-2]|uniref:SGNH hydrolase-type esterase domain-containing protein n=1 Tax=Kineosporia corallincola TaxID=2835133 RepID=A0ABS5T991_9ACTN|nr:GDSL-type esterase/lipase family protein [Kineosporia corallincola]MBT0767644.1 hypothetical protein [Kineosporia corallincola]
MRRIGTGAVMLSAGVVIGAVVSGGLSSGAGSTASAASPAPSASPTPTGTASTTPEATGSGTVADQSGTGTGTAEGTPGVTVTRSYSAADLAAAADAAARATSTYSAAEGSSVGFQGQTLPDLTVVPPTRTDGALKLTVGLGDSITYRTGSWFRRVCGAGVIYSCRDAGVRGDTTTGMLERLQTDVLDLEPDAVTIMAGTNDMLYGYSTVKSMRNIDELVTRVQASGATVVLCTISPRNATPKQALALNVAIRKYAKNHKVALLDVYPLLGNANGTFKKGLTNDGVHPNVKGMKLMADLAERKLPRLIGAS